MNPLFTYFIHRFLAPKKKWFPFISVYYLNYSCSFRCPFCSNGEGRPYHELSGKILPAEDVIRLLRIIREKCDYLVITGGEPLQHPDFSVIMKAISKMRFREVILTTNGFAVDKHLPAITDGVTTLVFSLNSLDPAKSDLFFGLSGEERGEILRKIMTNIDISDRLSGKKYRIHISSVVCPGNIKDLYEVYDFARGRNFIFAACPQLVGVKPHQDLINNEKYREFFTHLMDEKRKGNGVYGTIPYLKHMRDLCKFKCFPFTMLVVSPTGDVFYPCLEMGNLAGNLLDTRNLHEIKRRGEKKFGPQPVCDNRCQSACALGFSMLFRKPFSFLA